MLVEVKNCRLQQLYYCFKGNLHFFFVDSTNFSHFSNANWIQLLSSELNLDIDILWIIEIEYIKNFFVKTTDNFWMCFKVGQKYAL